MNKKDFSKAESISLAIEAVEIGKPDLAVSLLKEANSSERLQVLFKSGKSVTDLINVLQDELHRSIPLIDLAENTLYQKSNPEAMALNEKMFKYFGGKAEGGGFFIKANSPMLVPNFNQRLLSDTAANSLGGTLTRSDLSELPNIIPTLDKLGITKNFVKGIAVKQVIPMMLTNAITADLLNGVIIGSLDDPEFDLCPGDLKELTAQIALSRRFFTQANENTNELLKQMLYNAVWDSLMYRVFYGQIASGQSEGLYYKTDVQKIAGASFTNLIGYDMMKVVHGNEAPEENCVFVLNAATEKTLKTRDYGNRFVIEKGLMLDKPYVLSERIQNKHVWYGAHQSIVVTLFDTQLLINQYLNNEVLLQEFQDYSVDVRHPGWIVCAENVD